MKEKIKIEITRLKNTGFFSIFLSSVFSQMLVFLGSTIIVRILSKSDYGVYAYVLNCIAVITLLNDFGAGTAVLQYLTEKDRSTSEKGKVLKYAISICMTAAIFSGTLILLSNFFYPFKILQAQKLTKVLFLIPFLTTLGGLFPIILRSNLDNKRFAIYQIFSTFFSYLFLIIFSMFFGLKGSIFSQYAYYATIFVFGYLLSNKYIKKYKVDSKLDTKTKKEFLKFSISCQLNQTIGGMLIVVDTFIIGLIISKPQIIATYKVGSAIPHALTFISSCVAIYILPYFVRNNKNYSWLKKIFKKILLYGSLGYGIIFSIIIILSKYIIKIIYGSQYLNSVPIFIILMIGLFFSSAYKIPCINLVHSQKKIKINIIVNITSIILNAILNTIFIIRIGFVGAAITTTIINILVAVFYIIYCNWLLKKSEKNGGIRK